VVEATTDGGQTWQARLRTPISNGPNAVSPFLRLNMLTAGQGWAVSGGCTIGENGPCPGTVYVTSDGGFHWQPTSLRAIAIAGLGAGRAVAANDRAQTAAVTTDGGRTWAVQTQPAAISTSSFDGVGGMQVWATNRGDFLSRDGGSSWTAAPELAAPRFSYLSWHAVALGSDGAAVAITGPGAQCTGQAQIGRVEAVKPGAKPPAGASVLYLSSTGGARWDPSGLVLPFGVGILASAAVSGSRIAVIDACDRLRLSADDGARWTAQDLGSGAACTVSELTAEVWRTADGGGSWSQSWPAGLNR
jgi:hypothetical protein